jgi:protein-disulfide isomerase
MSSFAAKSPWIPFLKETAFYGVIVVVVGCLVTWLVMPKAPVTAQAQTIDRSAAEAKLLRDFLAIPTSQATVVEFMDFQCPPCRSSWPVLKRLLKDHPELTYRPINFPLQMHPFAFPAAIASEVARDNGKFDVVFDDLFSGATDLDVKSLNAYLSKHKMDPCVGTDRSKPFQDRVRKELALGGQLHIAGTPTIFLLATDGSLTEIHSFNVVPKLLTTRHG